VPSTTLGKVATGVAGTTGMGSVAVSAFAMLRMSQAHAVPGGMWASAVSTAAVAALVASLGIILEYRIRRLQVAARSKEAESAAALKRTRLEVLRSITDKATENPEQAQNYRELIRASAAFLSVEQNGTPLAELVREENGVRTGPGRSNGDRVQARRQRQRGGIPILEAEAGWQ
jgi:hypothetical protein